SDLERERAHEVEEGDVVERLVGRELAPALAVEALVAALFGEEVEDAMPLEFDLLLVLLEAPCDEVRNVEPGLQPVVDLGEEDLPLQVEAEVVGGAAMDRVHTDDLHRALAYGAEDTEPDLVA